MIRTLKDYPLLRAVQDAVDAIERCGASPELTAAVIAVSDVVRSEANRTLDALDAAQAKIAALREALARALDVIPDYTDGRNDALVEEIELVLAAPGEDKP